MSGIAGVVQPGGEPAAVAAALAAMLKTMRHRFPDGESTHVEAGFGLGAVDARLEPATGDPDARRWIASQDGDWLLFDGRLDAREALLASLRSAAPDARLEAATDAGLALHAYRCWGDAAFDRLEGDFAIAIRDSARRRLVLARDRFGVRPLYYARDRGNLAWASTTQALLALPWVEGRKNERALLDFLLFGYAADPWDSSFEGIVQVAPGHAVAIAEAGERRWRYWIPQPARIASGGLEAYAEQFRHLLDQAVADRLPAAKTGVLLSGGLDSTSVAAMASRHTRGTGRELHGFTVTCNTLWPEDAEGEYALQVARHCGFDTRLLPMDEVSPFQDWDRCATPALAPANTPFLANHQRVLQQASAMGIRFLLSGEGGDPGLETPAGHMRALAFRKGPFAFLSEIAGALRGRRSLRGIGLRSLLPARRTPQAMPFPKWIRPDVCREWGLADRWHRIQNPEPRTATRDEALAEDLQDVAWLLPALEQYEGAWGPMTVAHPLLDRRLVEFAIALPHYAAKDKLVMRRAMQGYLPDAVVARRKAHFRFDLVRHWLDRGGWQIPREGLDGVREWVDPRAHADAMQAYLRPDSGASVWDGIRLLLPVALDGWLGNATRAGALAPVAPRA